MKESEALVGTALDAGVNFIDTADVYSEGESERRVGAALKSLGRPREQVVVASKVRGRVGPGVNQIGLSRAHILAIIDGSLRRLGLDHEDLYQIHGFDPSTPIEETVRALDDVVRSGKARYTGFSNLPAWVASKAITFAEENGLARFQSAQVYYSIVGRDIEREIAPLLPGGRRRHLAVEPPRWRPIVRQVRRGQERSWRRPSSFVRLPTRKSGAPSTRASCSAESISRHRCLGRAHRACVAAHAAFRYQHHHRRKEERAACRESLGNATSTLRRACQDSRRGERTPGRVSGLDGRIPERP